MQYESRVHKSLLNARVNLVCYFLSLCVAFFSRKIFIDQLGVNFLGLTGTLSSLLGFLNLAELGVGSAIGYVLYKPIFDGDLSKINEIISVFGYLYRCIGLFILGCGVLLSSFLPWIFPDTPFSWGIIYLGYYAMLTASMLGYFVNYRQTLLSADQRNYEVTGYFQAVTSSKVILQMVLALYIRSFSLYLINELIFGIIYAYILNWRINRIYPWLKNEVKLGRKLFRKYPEIGKYVKQLFVHKIGGFVQFQITPFLIYSYVSLPIVTLYGNYTLVTNNVQRLFSGLLDSTSAGVGNLISEGNRQKIWETYKELLSVRILFAGILSANILYLSSPFISVWLGKEYVLSDLVIFLIVLQLFLLIARGTTDQFLFGYGLFYDIWAPAVESAIFIVTAMVCGNIWGLSGVLCGPILSLFIIVYIWKPYFLFSKGFKISTFNYWRLFATQILEIIVTYYISVHLSECFLPATSLTESWGNWLLGALIFAIVITVSSVLLFSLFSPDLRRFIFRFIKLKTKI